MRDNPARDLNELAVFTYVVEHGGFTAAAEATRLPKSNISRRVASLEKRIGVKLLERTTRKVHLTEVGQIYYQHCRRMLDEADHADLCIEHLMEIPRGKLRISASVTTGQYLLAPLVSEFLARHPDVQLEMLLTNRKVDVINEGFDLVVRIGDLEDSSLVARSLGRYGLFLYASPEYLKEKGEPEKPEDLTKHNCLVMSDMQTPTKWTLTNGDETRKITLTPRVTINDFNTLGHIVADGGGIAILPSYLHRDDYQNRLVRVLTDWTAPEIEFHVVFPSHRGATPKVRAFLDFLIVKLGK